MRRRDEARRSGARLAGERLRARVAHRVARFAGPLSIPPSRRVFGDMTDTSSLQGFGCQGGAARDEHMRNPLRRGPIGAISGRSGSLRLAAQDVALSRRKQGFESPRERHVPSSNAASLLLQPSASLLKAIITAV